MKNLVYRAQWGARPPKAVVQLPVEQISTLVVHYTASNADEQANHANCAARVRGVQNYHMDTQEWSDIAYNWLFCKHGYIFKGRGWGVRSAATGIANSFTQAACFLGDDTKNRADLTPEAKAALREIHRFMAQRVDRLKPVRGHRDFMSTSCPGDELYAYLKTLNR